MDILAKELHRTARKKFPRRKTIAKNIRDLIQIDLADFTNLKKYNKNYRFILVAINCYSRFAWGIPLKSKKADHVLNGLKKILLPYPPKFLQSDKGKEFYNFKVKNFLLKH